MRRAAGRWPYPLLLLWLLAAPAAAGTPAVDIEGAWIRQPPPGTQVAAGYLVLHNRGHLPVVIEAVSSPAFGAIEIHRTEVSDGIARMLRIESITIPPGQSFALEPGGHHLMLFRPRDTLAAGAERALTLHSADGRCIDFTATVMRAAPGTGP